MSASVTGIIDWKLSRNEEGHRTYTITHLVTTTSTNDGPATVLVASGLPLIGSIWTYGNDVDGWAFCLPTREVKKKSDQRQQAKFTQWEVTSTFSTNRESTRCQDETIEDPLQEPDRISGSFVKYTREVTKDKDGNRIKTSSHEIIRGPQVEFDHNRPTVTIEQNRASLELEVFSEMVDTVNNATLWGLDPPRS